MDSNSYIIHRYNKETHKIEYSRNGKEYSQNLRSHYSKKEGEIQHRMNDITDISCSENKKINIWVWYDHYEKTLKSMFKELVRISSINGINLHYTQEAFNDFVNMVYNESICETLEELDDSENA